LDHPHEERELGFQNVTDGWRVLHLLHMAQILVLIENGIGEIMEHFDIQIIIDIFHCLMIDQYRRSKVAIEIDSCGMDDADDVEPPFFIEK
jgi:hypothetical protein